MTTDGRARRKTRTPDASESQALVDANADLFSWIGEADIRVASSPLEGRVEDLFPEERALVARAVASRQSEFATGRLAARHLLSEWGVPDQPLLRDEDRVPLWPKGFQGSITHTRSWCVVAVARAGVARGVGLDVELDEPLKAELLEAICTAAEIEALPAGEAGLALATLHFSIKEAVYKACFPRLRERWDFPDVEVQLDPSAERFRATPPPSAGPAIEGRVLRRSGFILSSAVWPEAADAGERVD